MKKKGQPPAEVVPPPPPEWDPTTKEPWLLEFEKQPINDDKWTCIVTAAIENEVQDEKCIQAYTQCANTGLRKAVKVISMADVVRLLKEGSGGVTSSKKDTKSERNGPRSVQKHSRPDFRILDLAAKYATFTASDAKLPPDLTAAVIKLMILTLKEDHCLQKKINAVRTRKLREQRIKAKFIKELKPFEVREEEEEEEVEGKNSGNLLDLEEPIDDEPFAGPDLYILLTNFYNVLCFPELQAMNVPFAAILKISIRPELEEGTNGNEINVETGTKRPSVVFQFWKNLREECFVSGSRSRFKDILLLGYEAAWKDDDPKRNYRNVFHELTWTQYSVYSIVRQHQKYLHQLHVQRNFQCLEPLDLAKCDVYNKLCDALITGDQNSPLMVLYAMVEQVVLGVPSTEFLATDYQLKTSPIVSSRASSDELERPVVLVTPCLKCRGKKYESFCDKLKRENETLLVEKQADWAGEHFEGSYIPNEWEEMSPETTPVSGQDSHRTFSSIISKVLREQRTEREIREDKRWKAPSLCFYGDSIFLQTYYCDPRIFDSETIVQRFLKNSIIPLLWRHYPELMPDERAYYNFHTNSLRKISKEKAESLKIKMLFGIAMDCISKAQVVTVKDELEPPEVCGSDKEPPEVCGSYKEPPEVCGSDKEPRKLLEVRLNSSLLSILKAREKNFRSYFLKTFVLGNCLKKLGIEEYSLESYLDLTEPSSQQNFPPNDKAVKLPPMNVCGLTEKCEEEDTSEDDRILGNFFSVLKCREISKLGEVGKSNLDVFRVLLQNFKFYENLGPDLMIQRLVEAQENFNALQYLHFAPTDTLIVVLLNDYDYRGINCSSEFGVLLTPVCLHDFYRYVYPEIQNWLVEEEAEYTESVSQLIEKQKAREEKLDAAYLAQLKHKYCSMSEEKKEKFLDENVDDEQLGIKEKELRELPNKPKLTFQERISFVATNFTDARVETNGRISEFHSPDGTQVRAVIDSWSGEPELLRLRIKRSNFSLYYNQYLGKLSENRFILRIDSDIIFSFSIGDGFKYTVTVSWPTGLLLRPVWHDTFYIKQNYLNPYRRGWDIEEETSRCFLRSGHVIIFKRNGDYDVLYASGTRCNYIVSGTTPRYEIFSTTGEVWQVRTSRPCAGKKVLITINKVFLGVDPQTRETFYKREDGTYSMLWPSAKLVTNFPDGTKITSIPYFEEEEEILEWTSEEIDYFLDLEMKFRLEQESRRSKAILRNSSSMRNSSSIRNSRSSIFTGFVMVSSENLIEHPKYSSVYFNPKNPLVKMTMPEQLTLLMDMDGNYEVQQGVNVLSVSDTEVEFFKRCPECEQKSTVWLYLDSREILCKCVDLFQHGFLIFSDGSMNYLKCYEDLDGEGAGENEGVQRQSISENCQALHLKNQCLRQRCFALERDLSGIEFLHTGCLALHFNHLPDKTHFDLNTDDPDNICHTTNSPIYKIGYEKWTMEYEENNSFPIGLKKKDLKELGTKQVTSNNFKYPFPKHHNCGNQQSNEKTDRDVKEPKAIVSRTFRCLSDDPKLVMDNLQTWVKVYQKRAAKIYNEYKNHKVEFDRSCDSRYVEMRLRKIALTLSQSLNMYPHLCMNLPSTEKDIHYFGHFINSNEGMGIPSHGEPSLLPTCKQIPERLPRISNFSSIHEESESPRST